MILLAACARGEPQDNILEIPVPPVVIEEIPDQDSYPAEDNNIIVESDNTLLDIPPVNEYLIFLDFEPEERLIRGHESVRYTNRTGVPLDELVFRVPLNAWSANEAMVPYPVEFHNLIFRNGHSYGSMEILHVSQDSEELAFILSGTVLNISLPRTLAPYETIQIHIQFEAYIPMIAHRIGANEHAVWAGTFLPTEAVFGIDGWHTEPYYPMGRPFMMEAANYIVEISTPRGYIVAGTGTKSEVYFDDRKVTTFIAHMTRDFAFAISPYFQRVSQQIPSGAVEVILYHYTPELPIERILNIALETMTFFEETVGPYPYPQLSIVETDMFRSGEKFSAMIFMDSVHLRTSQTLSSLRHEIGNQWFSVVVGTNPIEESWLSGGLTHFLHGGLLGQPRELRAAIERDHMYLTERIGQIRNIDSRRIASRIDLYETWHDYFRIQHRKAQLMFYSLYREMGEENFRELLREYYMQFAFRIASSSDFITLAEEIHGRSLQRFFSYWLNSVELPDLP